MSISRGPSDNIGSAEAAGLRGSRRIFVCFYAVVIAVIVAGVGFGYFFGHPKEGHHRHLGTLLAVVGIAVVVTVVSGGLTWRWVSRHGPTRRLLQFSWRTRRRVGRALRKGEPIRPGDQSAADAIVDAYARRPAGIWMMSALVLIWLVKVPLDHGPARFLDAGLVVLYLALIPRSLHTRRKILNRYATHDAMKVRSGSDRDPTLPS